MVELDSGVGWGWEGHTGGQKSSWKSTTRRAGLKVSDMFVALMTEKVEF